MPGDTLKACEAVFELRDAIAVSLRVRKGAELTELIIFERANNMAMALVEQFEIRRRDEPRQLSTACEFNGHQMCGGVDCRCDCHDAAIGTIHPPATHKED